MIEKNPNWDLIGYILSSHNRREVMFKLKNEVMTPSQISACTKINISHVSHILNELRKKQTVECLNPTAKKGRIYSLTDLGKDVVKQIEKIS